MTASQEFPKEKRSLDSSCDREKLTKVLGGIRSTRGSRKVFRHRRSGNREIIAKTEVRRLKDPIVAMVDTNCDPDLIDYISPGNDDAIRSRSAFSDKMADAVAMERSGSRNACRGKRQRSDRR